MTTYQTPKGTVTAMSWEEYQVKKGEQIRIDEFFNQAIERHPHHKHEFLIIKKEINK